MAKLFMIRTQGTGVHHEKVYASRPSKREVERLLETELMNHGLDPKSGGPRRRWAKVIEIELDESTCSAEDAAPDETFGVFDEKLFEKAKAAAAEPKGGKASETPIAFEGQGRVINPGDPGHAEATSEELGNVAK